MHFTEYLKATRFHLMFTFASFFISPVFALYLSDLGFSNISLGIFFGITPLVLIFTSPILGRISDDIGREVIIFWALIAEIAAVIIYLLCTSFSWYLIVARVLDAIAVMTITMLSVALIEDKIDGNSHRGKYTGISFSLEYLGRIAAPILSGFVADYFFIKAPFIVATVIFILLLTFIPKNKWVSKKKISKKDLSLLQDLKEFLSYRRLRGMAVLGFVMHATNPILQIFLPLYIVNSLGLSYVYVGYALFALGIGHIFQYWFGNIADSKVYVIVLLGTLISGIFLTLMLKAEGYFLLVLFLFLKGIGTSMWNISAWTLMSDIGEVEKIEGEIIGSYISIAKIGSFISFIASGFIVTHFGIPILFMLHGLLIIIGTLIACPMLRNKSLILVKKKNI